MTTPEQEYDKNFAYFVWLVEKEFNVGPVTSEFPVMKLFNLADEYNTKQYKQAMTKGMNSSPQTVK